MYELIDDVHREMNRRGRIGADRHTKLLILLSRHMYSEVLNQTGDMGVLYELVSQGTLFGNKVYAISCDAVEDVIPAWQIAEVPHSD